MSSVEWHRLYNKERLRANAAEEKLKALEARTPAPATDVDALLAEAGYKAVLAALRQEAVDKCAGGFGAPDLDADYQLSLSLLVREVYQILNIEQHIDALATALRETLAERDQMRESAQVGKDRWQDTAEQLAEAQADRDAERARAEKAEAERDEANSTLDMYAKAWWRELKGPYRNKRHEIDALVLTTRERLSDLAAARAELGALGEVEYIREAGRSFGARNFIETVSDDPRCVAIRRVLKGGAA